MLTIIAIATHKGGTGKTVTSMAVACSLARGGKRTLLIDLDPQGHSTIGLGVQVAPDDPTLRDVLSDSQIAIERAAKETHIPLLHVVPSDIRLERVTHHMYTRPKREELLKRALGPVWEDYDFVVLDCPPSLGPLTEAAIGAADVVIVPSQMEARAADGLVDVLELISLIKGETFDRWRILLTRLDPRKSVTNQAVMAGLANWQDRLLQTTIPQSEPLNQAQIQRTDIFTFDPKSPGAQAYDALTKELLDYVG